MMTRSFRCACNSTTRIPELYQFIQKTCWLRFGCYVANPVADEQSLWKSNELGGNICEVDELFVAAEHRSQGHGKSLFEAISHGELWPTPIAGIVLGVTPDNVRARRLYERLGFRAAGISMVRRLP